QAFDECDIDKDGKLSLSEFRMWIKRTPAVKRFLQSVFPYDEHRDYRGDTKELPFIHNHADDATPQGSPGGGGRRGSGERGGAPAAGSREEALSLLQRAQAPPEQPPAAPSYDDLPSMSKHRHSMKIQTSVRRGPRTYALAIVNLGLGFMLLETARAECGSGVARKGFLSKRGQRTKQWQRRWYMLVGNCIYYYRNEQDRTPRGVIFLIGSFIEPLREEESEKTGHWGLDIVRSQEQGVRRCLYASSKSERDAWVRDLRRASEVIPIEEDFEIGEELGKGQFSRVCLCVNKRTLERKAVKIIEKDTMDAEERELLRAEIAIMKLVEHPNIIAMEAVYESRQHIFIVMELHSGGELFDRINGRPRLTEDEAFCVIYPLIESVAYLHEMGIVHRDLKPENILCGQKMGDIKIADFGLSKLVLPDEIMKMPCGTLSYVAPEVLTLNGYGREADMWSVGTIMYLLLRGRLPFDADGDSRGKIIERTIHGTIDTEDATWQALSEDARHLMLGLLNKATDIKRRTSAKEALVHPWITARVDRMAEDPAAFDL
ncbi:kinase-like domain-containing protein, partial [Tribonema minus]